MTINLILLVFAASMLWAAITDIRSYILSNKLCLMVVALYFIFIAALYFSGTSPTWTYIGYSFAIAIGCFIFLVVLFAYGFIGGGDVKLIPAVLLWAGPAYSLKFILITTICGGFVAILTICCRNIKSYLSNVKSSENINFFMRESSELVNNDNNIPYGIGISVGGLYVAFQLYQALN